VVGKLVNNLVVAIGVLLLSRPTSFLVAAFTSRWEQNLGERRDNLPGAGMWIGLIERQFIFLFVLSGHIEAVGFLIAAKSVFRFGDLKQPGDRERTEYVLIGTLLSFGIAMAVALGVRGVLPAD